jgi:hypothetical protein
LAHNTITLWPSYGTVKRKWIRQGLLTGNFA